MQGMENLMVVPGNAGGIIGKFFYYSLANILIPKEQFIRVGMDFGLPKFKPAPIETRQPLLRSGSK